jgi:hypothetical protein
MTYGIVWACHGCGEERASEWISVAHRRVQTPSNMVQINARYCNDRSSCLRKVADVLDAWARPLEEEGAKHHEAVDRSPQA